MFILLFLFCFLTYMAPSFITGARERWLLTSNPVEADNAIIDTVYSNRYNKLYDRRVNGDLDINYIKDNADKRSAYNVYYYYEVDELIYRGSEYISRKELRTLSRDDLKIYYAKDDVGISTIGYILKQNRIFNYIRVIFAYFSNILALVFLYRLTGILKKDERLETYIGKEMQLRLFPVEITSFPKIPTMGIIFYEYKGHYKGKEFKERTSFYMDTSLEKHKKITLFNAYNQDRLLSYNREPQISINLSKDGKTIAPTKETTAVSRLPLPFYIRNITHQAKEFALALYIDDEIKPILLDQNLARLDLTCDEKKAIFAARDVGEISEVSESSAPGSQFFTRRIKRNIYYHKPSNGFGKKL